MINEIRKRPFARPLICWLSGILLYSYLLPESTFYIGIAATTGFGCMIFSYRKHPGYRHRWVWGLGFILALTTLSYIYTSTQDNGLYSPILPDIQTKAENIQHTLIRKIDKLDMTDQEKSLLSTLTVGYRQSLERETRQRFSVTGVAHILAVSGFHVGVVAGFIGILFYPFPYTGWNKRLRPLIIMLFTWLYIFVTGAAPSAIRAGLMLSFFLAGQLLGRKTERYNTLAAAAYCMLVINPFYLFDIGFQLSFLAVFFILFLQPRLDRLISVRNPLIAIPWQWVTLTLSAQAGVSLLCLFYFGYLPSYFLLANVPVVALSTLLIPAALVWLVLPTGTPGIGLLEKVITGLVRTLNETVSLFSSLPGNKLVLNWDIYIFGAAVSLVICYLVFNQTKQPRILLTGISITLVLLAVSIYTKKAYL